MKMSANACRTIGSSRIADGGGSLRVDVDQDVDAVFQIRQHRLAQRAVIIPVHLRVLQKIALFQFCEKICV